jgi:hypothetical protein
MNKTQLTVQPFKSAGFSIFELVAFIITSAIIYSYAANQFTAFPGEAERANFLAVSTQIQTGVNMEMMFGLKAFSGAPVQQYEGANPMDLMLEPPSNYLGAFPVVNLAAMPRRSWYFDTAGRELVYLVNDSAQVYLIQNGASVQSNEIRFKITADYSEVNSSTGIPVEIGGRAGSSKQRLNGMVFRPTVPFQWSSQGGAELIAAATN